MIEYNHNKQDVLPAEEEHDKENNHPQAVSSELSEDESVPSMLSDKESTEEHGSTADAGNDIQSFQSMKQTIIVQQELIMMLSSLVATNQHEHNIAEVNSESLQAMKQTISSQEQLISILKSSLKEANISPAGKLKNDDEQTQFYTGLNSYALFDSLSDLLGSVFKNPNINHGILTIKDQFLLVLMKLRMGFPNKELAYRFGVSLGRVSQIFHEWIDIMARELNQLIVWPERKMIRETLPECFKPKYAQATCIIDCSEIFIERATSLVARSETYSNYKSHNTANFFVAISPTGAIIFISKCWGGRASDKLITSKCGFLDKLIHGDLVLADRGFDIAEDLGLRGTTLAIPAFTKGKLQLSQREVETSQTISNVRIHVERAIGQMKCFKILQNTFPISLLKTSQENDFTTIDKILVVCAALCNLQPPLA